MDQKRLLSVEFQIVANLKFKFNGKSSATRSGDLYVRNGSLDLREMSDVTNEVIDSHAKAIIMCCCPSYDKSRNANEFICSMI